MKADKDETGNIRGLDKAKVGKGGGNLQQLRNNQEKLMNAPVQQSNI